MRIVLALLLLTSACGRIHFDDVSEGGSGSGALGDAALDNDGQPLTDGGGIPLNDVGSGVCQGPEPEQCDPCTDEDVICGYAVNVCTCGDSYWHCNPPNPAACPATAPVPFSPCTQAATCIYNANQHYTCMFNQWTVIQFMCAGGG